MSVYSDVQILNPHIALAIDKISDKLEGGKNKKNLSDLTDKDLTKLTTQISKLSEALKNKALKMLGWDGVEFSVTAESDQELRYLMTFSKKNAEKHTKLPPRFEGLIYFKNDKSLPIRELVGRVNNAVPIGELYELLELIYKESHMVKKAKEG